MSLEKATLTNLDRDESIDVLFNPREYTVRKSTHWEQHRSPGSDAPPLEFTSGASSTLAMELLFDTWEAGKDVREHTSRVLALATVDKELKRPPRVLFSWGGFTFEGVLEEVTQRFILFARSGMPVRALLQVSLREYRPPKRVERTSRDSRSTTRTRTVQQGETLRTIAAETLGDPARWREIALANDIDDPDDLPPGRNLRLPETAGLGGER